MADDYTLSLSQIAAQLNDEKVDIAESTVRKYARLYKDFLPSRKLEGVRWEKYLPNAIAIVKRIFVLSEGGKSRHEIKTALKAEGFGMTLEGDATETNATVSEPTQPYNHTPATEPVPHGNNIVELHAQHSDLIARYHISVMQEAAESLKLYHTLMTEKNVQIKELEGLVTRLKRENAEVQKKCEEELNKILDEVIRWRARTLPKDKSRQRKQELA